MQRVKRAAFLSSFLTFLLALFLPGLGCVSPRSEASLQNRTKAIVWIATTKCLQERPEWRPQFAVALADLKVLQQTEVIGLPEILAIVHRLPIKELRDGDAALIITGSMLFFEDEIGTIAIEKPTWLRAVVNGMVQGLQLAGV